MGYCLVLAGMMGAMAVGFAAWGAHGATGEAAIWVERASHIQLVHAAALLGLARLADSGPRLIRLGAGLLGSGALLFAVTLYLKALGHPLPIPMTAPIGGITMMAGWGALTLAGIQSFRRPRV